VSGLVLQPHIALDRVRGPLDTLVVSGGRGPEQFAADRALVAQVRRLARRSRRVASVCTGATILAAVGLLDGGGLVTYLHRPGNQAQVSMFVAPPAPEHAVVRRLVVHIVTNLDGPSRRLRCLVRSASARAS
jgi:putative intracellular protease/amidase